MKEITDNGKVKDYWNPALEMSSLQGEMQITYAQIVKVFGKENSKGDEYKTQAEWHIMTPDGIATIYDYKQGKAYCGHEGIAKSKVTDWHIGGHTKEVVKWIFLALGVK